MDNNNSSNNTAKWLSWAAWITLLFAVLANTAIVAYQHGEVVAEEIATEQHLQQIDRRLDSIEQALRERSGR